MYLLFKDHKLWTVEMGGAPPTRPVCSAGSGQNDHMSENVSLLLEPVANTKETGMEVTSTPNMVSVITVAGSSRTLTWWRWIWSWREKRKHCTFTGAERNQKYRKEEFSGYDRSTRSKVECTKA